jgi:hypothetical protein
MPEKEYILFCDESDKVGPYYSNFYGGLIVGASEYESITQRLQEVKQAHNLLSEVKWEKVTDQYLAKYLTLMAAFFQEINAGRVKVRIMFRQSALEPCGLTSEQIGSSYYRLYYQFIKHAFGLRHIPLAPAGTFLRLYFDQFPDTGKQVQTFKSFIRALDGSPEFKNAHLHIRQNDIAEVRSHDHVLLQCLDVVLGAMAFRLNGKHLSKPPGQRRRGKRTIAKHKLYNAIRNHVCSVTNRPHFNIGITTGHKQGAASRWLDTYRHWSFRPKEFRYAEGKTKAWQRKNPA